MILKNISFFNRTLLKPHLLRFYFLCTYHLVLQTITAKLTVNLAVILFD